MRKVIQKSFSKKIVQSQKKVAVKQWATAMITKYPQKPCNEHKPKSTK